MNDVDFGENEYRILDLIRKYGYNSTSYNILIGNKKYFFSEKGIEGVIAYIEIADIFLVAGDPVCDDQNIINFVHEFRLFCRRNNKDCCFQAISKKVKDILEIMGFNYIKIGEEPFFDLDEWNTAGGRFMDLRNEINHAKKDGFRVEEYRPLEKRDRDYEYHMAALSELWQKSKKTGEFSFLVGTASLDDPRDRKYFLVFNQENKLEAFLVCVPIFSRNGVYFDILRRKEDPEKGTTELLITDTFRILREQGYKLVTLGSAPLADVTKDEKKKEFIYKALDFAYNNLNYFYKFKPLFNYKQKFGPTFWEPKYMAFYPPNFKSKYVFAILKAYDPGGISDILLSSFKGIWKNVKNIGT
ncbi:MAG: DUF2156 domain-containing protein [Candidatus Aenigmatarchaeota archaeon]